MNNFDTPEEIEKRATQEDPIVMYLIVRESLEMSAGKIASQVAHAAGSIVQKYYIQNQDMLLAKIVGGLDDKDMIYNYGFTEASFNMMKEWFKGSYRKIVLRASDKEWEKIKIFYQEQCVVIKDNGLTEIPAGSETCIGLFPQRKSQRDKIIKRLQVF